MLIEMELKVFAKSPKMTSLFVLNSNVAIAVSVVNVPESVDNVFF